LSIVNTSFSGANKALINAIRKEVFILEQGVPPELEFDGLDDTAAHVLAFVSDQPVGTGRVLADGHIGRIAVLCDCRGQGLGAEIVLALVDEAAKAGCNEVYLGAQKHAVGFYEKLGFVAYGEDFMDAGIPHIHMKMSIGAETGA